MSAPENNKPAAGKAADSEQIAQQFVAAELAKARSSIKKARVVSILMLAFVAGYMTILTNKLGPVLSPKGAADTATALISGQVSERAPMIANQLKEQIPAMVAKIPDTVIQKMPEWREQIETKLEDTLTDNLRDQAANFGKHLDAFLTDHQQQIGELLNAANDKDKLRVVMSDIEKDMLAFLGESTNGKESIKQKIDQALQTMTRMEKMMDRLANANDLTPQEKKTRRTIAIITQKIELSRE
jgi:hypothetical protein